ncbi:MAG: hypothetical protein ACLFTT_14590 [Candidatus Hydrogenedentota bacterium]
MAFKGPAYLKTTWAFEERPVASAKLNTWDDRIEGALELVFLFISQSWRNEDGILRGAASNLAVQATATPGLAVTVAPGYALIGGFPYQLTDPTETVDVIPPSTEDRVDLVQARLDTWGVSIKTGIEAAEPAAPTPGSDCIALAELYLRPGMTAIKNADDATNGYITDARTFL